MELYNISSFIFDLSSLPRYCGGKPEIEKIAWFRDHVYWHKNALIDAENISFILDEAPGEQRAEINGSAVVFRKKDDTSMRVSCTASGTVVTTLATTKRNELLFRYPAKTALMPEYPFINIPFPMTERFGRFLHELEDMLEDLHTPGTADQLDLLALAMTAEALASSANSGNNAGDSLHSKLSRIHALIAANPAMDTNITVLAAEFGMSRAAFYREWKKLFQISPYEFMLKKRLQNAQWLLHHTAKTIKEIAAATGFKSTPVFCDIFKKNFAVSPLAFRRDSRG